MNIFSDFFKDFPILTQLIFDSRTIVGNGHSLSMLESPVREFARSRELISIVNACLNGFEGAPGAQFPFMGQDHLIFCSDVDGVTISIGETHATSDKSAFYSSPNEVLLCAITSGGFEYQKTSISDNWNCDIFSKDVYLASPKFFQCDYGSTILVSTQDVFDYCSAGGLVLKIAAPTRIGLMWDFDRDLLTASRVFASTLEATTDSYLLRFLAEYGNSESVSAICKLKSHPFHYLRWEVAKALGQLSEDELRKTLHEFKCDVHPHVRDAAILTLEKIGEENGF